MVSTLLMSGFDIPANAINISPAAAFDLDLTEFNLVGGERYNYGKFNVAATSNSIRFDLGSTSTKTCDHLIIARCDILKTAGLTGITLARGTDGSTFNTEYSDASMASATLYGPRSDDYLAEFTTSAAYEWWRLTYTGSSSKFAHSKISFGQSFDIGKSPDDYDFDRVPAKEALWYSDSGAEYQSRVDEQIYRFSFSWVGLTAAKVQTFFDTYVRYKHVRPFFLYTTATTPNHILLDNQRVMHVRLVSAERGLVRSSYQNLTATFEEVLG